MSIWTLARPKSILHARCFSSTSNVARTPNPHSVNLPPEKMRALIAMYHQADTFVTPENLDDKIADAFTRRPEVAVNESTTLSLSDFESLLRDRVHAPLVTEWNARAASYNARKEFDQASATPDSLWSGHQYGSVRNLKVLEALYGVETLGKSGTALPGWDALNDHGEMIKMSDKEDRERYEESDY
jgi:hypothetical protein